MAEAAVTGTAFAALYDRYAQRAYNLGYRLTGSESDAADATQEAFLRMMRRLQNSEDGEPAFGTCLFAATRKACHDLIQKRPPAAPSDMTAQTIRDANRRLPEHQREALALRGLEGLSYDEIATIMEMNGNSVAQLISRARINLDDELRGTPLAAVAAPSPECERALPLIAARQDGQLEAGSDDDAWLDAHLTGCERCRLGVEAMREAGVSYRAWAPIAVVPWLREETMAQAATLADADWSEAIASRAGDGRPSRRRRAIAAAGLGAVLLGAGTAAVLAGDEPAPIQRQAAADTQPATSGPASETKPEPQRQRRGRREAPRKDTPARATTAALSPPLQPQAAAGGSPPDEPAQPAADHQGASGLQPPQVAATPEPKRKPIPAPQPAPAPATPTEAQEPAPAPVEAPAPEHPSKGKGPPAEVPPRGNR